MRLTQVARKLRRNQTEAEKLVWSKLRNRVFMGFKFRRQVMIGNYIADFVCMERRLVVELDGGQHGDQEDAARTAFLESQGFIVKRYWNNDVLTNMGGVFEDLMATFDTLTPTLSLQGEGAGRGEAA